MEPGVYGGGAIEEVSLDSVRFAPVPHKFEAGTPNISGAIGLGAACRYLTEIGIEAIQKHSEEISDYTISKLKEISGVKIYCHPDPEKNIGVVSFSVEGVHPHDVGEILSRKNIAIRGGHHCAMPLLSAMKISSLNRASFYLYTSKEDVDALAQEILEVKKTFDK
jgi:cysteine desulfurase/selenocysteine lyase